MDNSDNTIRFNIVLDAADTIRKIDTLKSKMNSIGKDGQMQNNLNNFTNSYSNAISQLTKQAEAAYRQFKESGNIEAFSQYQSLIPKIKQLNNEYQLFNNTLGLTAKSGGSLDNVFSRVNSHLSWIGSGALIAGVAAIPALVTDIARETEVLGNKIKQNLELADQYRNNHQGLESDMKHLNDVAGVFAMGFGANIKDVMEMMQVISRRFKSPEEITYFTNLAMIMHKLDFVSPKQAAEDLEATILSMGLDFNQARDFIDQFSVAVHVARVTGTDLLAALQRSGSSFKNMNMNTAEAIALISTLSTVTAKAGENVGISLNSLITNVDFKKAAQALQAYSIEVYDANGKMRDGVDIWRDMARVVNGLLAEGNEQKANELAIALSGGKFRINDLKAILNNWEQFEKILDEIKTKASPELTAELLQTGLQSFDTNLKQLTASLQVFGIVIGNETMPSLKSMVIGLTEGVQWLNEHREAVGTCISVLGKFVEALVLYKGWQLLANTELGKFVLGIQSAIGMGVPFETAVAGMGTKVKTLTVALGAATLQLAAFLTLAMALNEMVNAANQAHAEKDYLNTHPDSEGIRAIKEDDPIKDLIYERDRLADMPGVLNTNRISQLNEQIRQKLAENKAKNSLSDVQKMVNEAAKTMNKNPLLTNPVGSTYEPVAGRDIGNSPSSGTAGSSDAGMRYAPDHSDEIAKLWAKHDVSTMLADDKVKADEYKEALSKVNTEQELFGVTSKNSADKVTLMSQRILELVGSATKMQEYETQYEQEANNIIANSQVVVNALNEKKTSWAQLSKEEQEEFVHAYENDIKEQKLLLTLLDLADKIKIKIADNKREITTLGNDILKDNKRTPEQLYNSKMQDMEYSKNHEIAGLGYQPDSEKQRLIQYKYSLLELQAAQDRLNEIQNTPNHSEQDLKKQEANVDSLRLKVEEYGDTLSKIKSQELEFFSDILLQGTHFKDEFKKLWTQLANDALSLLITGKHSSSGGGLLGSLLGLFGGSKTTSGKGLMLSEARGYANGGITDTEQIAAISEGNKKEAIIPMEGTNKERGRSLWEKAGQDTGWLNELKKQPKGTEMVPYFKNPELAKQVVNVNVSQNDAHIAELQTANKLMMQQNQMILEMLNNGGGNKGGVAQPIVMSNKMSDDELYNQINRLKSNGYKF